MVESKPSRFVRWFIYFYISSFAVIAFLNGNHEFLFYSLIYLFLLLLISLFQRRYGFALQLPGLLLLGFAILGLAHFFGGFLHLGGIRLYDMMLGWFRYDNYVHAYGSFLITVACFNLILPYLDEKIFTRRMYLVLIMLMISLGVGSLNEMVEFAAVTFLNATGIGGYENNAMDLVFNLVGAIAGCGFVVLFLLKQRLSQRNFPLP